MVKKMKEKYQKVVEKNQPNEPKTKYAFIAFLSGGLMGVLGNFLIDFYGYFFSLSTSDATVLMIMTLIFLACLLTALGVFDNLVKVCRMGLIIPITGFAHSIQSAALDYKKEGPIYGLGSNMFKLAGSVLLYGISAAYIFGIIRYWIGG